MNVASINKQALAQTYYILNSFSESDKNKIPNNLINTISENMDKEYKNTSELFEETKEILYAILNKYILSQAQKDKLAEYYKYYDSKMEKLKSKKYQNKNLFKNNQDQIEQKIKNNIVNNSLAVHKENIFVKFINKIKSMFKNVK